MHHSMLFPLRLLYISSLIVVLFSGNLLTAERIFAPDRRAAALKACRDFSSHIVDNRPGAARRLSTPEGWYMTDMLTSLFARFPRSRDKTRENLAKNALDIKILTSETVLCDTTKGLKEGKGFTFAWSNGSWRLTPVPGPGQKKSDSLHKALNTPEERLLHACTTYWQAILYGNLPMAVSYIRNMDQQKKEFIEGLLSSPEEQRKDFIFGFLGSLSVKVDGPKKGRCGLPHHFEEESASVLIRGEIGWQFEEPPGR